ncbi:response regulator transcription factor [Roseomonas sp. 18066]|uniref:response regulator transcription factor n=1 Tax=Roseomonas sp. 18066 TaxID=2681412 RepID=UPI00135BEC91|nr:response regulator transcription factor [Roseomonas sp. 18066]
MSPPGDDAGMPLDPLVLVVDDEAAWAEELCSTVGRYGFRGRAGNSWDDLQRIMAEEEPDAILLDQRLGRVDTVSRLPELRQATDATIMVITANVSEVDRILGLENGADDFLIKPISGREVVARLRARLRRRPEAATPAPPRPAGAPGTPARPGGSWRFDPRGGGLWRPDGSRVHLSLAEFRVLAALYQASPQSVSRDALSQIAFGRPWHFGDRAVDNSILGLRRKLGDLRLGGTLRTIRAVGYVFTGFPED